MQFKTLHDTGGNTDTQSNNNSYTPQPSNTLPNNPLPSNQLPNNTNATEQSFTKKSVSKEHSNNDRKSKTVRVSPEALDVIWLIVAEHRCSLKNAVDVMARNYTTDVATGSGSYSVCE